MAGVGVGFTIASLALSAGGSAMSFAQAGKQNKLRKEAEAEAEKSMEQARKILGINYLEGLSLPKEPYERAREAMLVQGASALQAAQEAETRGVASTAGRTAMAQQAAQREIAGAQADRLLELEKLGAAEEARLQSGLADLELMGLLGAQQAARDSQMAQMKAVQAGFTGLEKLGKTALDYKQELLPLFSSQKTPDFASVGGSQISLEAIKANPTLYGQYQGQTVYLPGIFGDGLEFTNPIDQVSTLPQLSYLPPKLIAPTTGG